MPRVSATTPSRTAEVSPVASMMRGQGECYPLDLTMVEVVDRYLDLLPAVPFYATAAMGMALVYDAIRGLV